MSSAITTLIDSLRQQAQHGLKVVGPTKIAGEVTVQSSKNSTNKLVAAAVAMPGKYLFKQFPQILDPLEMLHIVEYLGGEVTLNDDRSVLIDTTHIKNRGIPYSLTKTTTSAFGFAGALLGRFNSVSIGKPGGDTLGPRPVDLHSDGFRALGAEIEETEEVLTGDWNETWSETHFAMRMASTGAGVNFVLAVAAHHAKAYLENPPLDGDMQAMYSLLRQSGVKIEIEGSVLSIDATEAYVVESTIEFTCWPDRNDAFTWLAYGTLSQEGLVINNVKLDDLAAAISVMKSLGVGIEERNNTQLVVKAPTEESNIQDITIVAGLGEQFHSDWAPLLQVVLTQLNGSSRIIETLFSERVRQAELLAEMGADIKISGGAVPEGVSLHFRADPETARYLIDVNGPSDLTAILAAVGNDVRACAAMIMAASQAAGESHLSEVSALYRGYENIIERLHSIGVNVTLDTKDA